jgi:hypothetical protein
MKLCESASPDRSIGERKARARLTTDLAGETADNPTPWDVSAVSHAAGACNSESTELLPDPPLAETTVLSLAQQAPNAG